MSALKCMPRNRGAPLPPLPDLAVIRPSTKVEAATHHGADDPRHGLGRLVETQAPSLRGGRGVPADEGHEGRVRQRVAHDVHCEQLCTRAAKTREGKGEGRV